MPKLSQEQREIIQEYGHLFVSTGGNDIIELIERVGVNYANSPVVAELQGSCYSQIQLLQKLRAGGLLVQKVAVEHEKHPAEEPVAVPDMQRETDSDGAKYIHCVNTNCASNGGTDWGDTPRGQDLANQTQPATIQHQWGCRANAFGECNMGCTDQAQHTPAPIRAPSVGAIMALADAYAEARACEVTATTDDDLCGEERTALMGAVVSAVNTTRQAVAPVAQASMPFCRLEWLIGETVTAEQVVEMSKQGIQLYAGHAPIFTPLTESQLASACLRFRHDFGLLSESDRQALIAQAKDWDQALRGAREIYITGPGVSCPKAAL